MRPASLQRSLVMLEIVAFATLLRSVAFDRWITVLMSALLIVGALGARRGKSWGVALAFASSIFFPLAFILEMAPAWFVFVGAIAAAPFALTWRAFARFDRVATAWLAGLAVGVGSLAAIVWQQIAWPLFSTFPSLFPSARPQHGLLVLALMAAGGLVGVTRWRAARRLGAEEGTAPREPVRIARAAEAEPTMDDWLEAEHEATEALSKHVGPAASGRR